MAHSAQGFTGSIDQSAWSRLITLQSATTFRLQTPGAWQPSVNTSVARTITVATGAAVCCGVLDTTDTAYNIAFGANTGTATRIDALVARYDWATTSVSFVPIQGSTVAPSILNVGTVADSARITQIPGVRYDAVIAYVPIAVNAAVLPTTGTGVFTDVRLADGNAWPAGRPMYIQSTAPTTALDGSLWFQTP